MVDTGQVPAHTNPKMFQGVLRTFAAGRRARYRPAHRYEQALHLVLCQDPRKDDLSNEEEFAKQIETWREFAPHLRCWKTPGNHFAILNPPFVDDLAAWWKTNCLS